MLEAELLMLNKLFLGFMDSDSNLKKSDQNALAHLCVPAVPHRPWKWPRSSRVVHFQYSEFILVITCWGCIWSTLGMNTENFLFSKNCSCSTGTFCFLLVLQLAGLFLRRISSSSFAEVCISFLISQHTDLSYRQMHYVLHISSLSGCQRCISISAPHESAEHLYKSSLPIKLF